MLQESNRLELKEKLNEKLEREICAFLNNREGGVLYIGVADNGSVVGVSDADALQKKVAERIRDNILPSALGLYDVTSEEMGDKTIIKVIVSSGTEKPYYIKEKGMSSSGCFIRVGTTVQPMSTSMIDELYSKRLRNQTLRNIPSPRQDLTFSQLKIYYEERGFALNDRFASTLELLTSEGKYNYVAYLLADENGVSIKVAKYAGKDKVDLVENEEYGYCSIIKAAHRVLDKFEIENVTRTKITGKERIDRTLVGRVPLREAIINAIVHNDYTREIPPVFEIFSDRIEITSDGGLIYGQSEEDFFSLASMPRNRELMRVFKDVGLVEQLGSGMSRILKVYDKNIFHISPRSIKVVFPYSEELKVDGNVDGKVDGKVASGLNPTQLKIINAMKNDPMITATKLAKQFGMSEYGIRKNIAKLKEAGVIERLGSDKNGSWKVNE